MSSRERYREAKQIFLEALARPEGQRENFLARRCGKNPYLRAEVAELLDHHESGSSEGSRFTPGSLIGNRYRVVELLGQGGMGEVYRAEDLELRQAVALKMLPAEVARDLAAMDRLRGEVRLALRVTHGNVCRIYDLGEVDGEPFIAMEYVPGEDLDSLLHRIGRLPVDKALEVAQQLAAGLAAAHAAGVVHRDLKPANVLVDLEGRVRITDFGIAVPAEEGGLPWARAGTPAYMSPEQLAGREVSERSDLFSLGLVLYEMVTGRPAFAGERTSRVRAEDTERVPSPSSLVSNIDQRLEQVILHCLREDPEERPASAMEVLTELQGGDALEAVIAVGRTPSPEEVAEGTGGALLSIRQLAATLAGIALLLAAAVLLGESAYRWADVGLDKPPEVLVEKAREVLASARRTESQPHFAWGYLQPIDESSFEKLRFWYRESPDPLIPSDVYNVLSMEAKVELWDPPPLDPGMARVDLDGSGRLSYLRIVPPVAQPGSAGVADWSPLMRRAGIDPDTVRPIEPLQVPRVWGDRLLAWKGELGPDQPRVVHAASLAGRAVYFDVSRPEEVAGYESEPVALWEIVGTFDQLLWFALLVGGSVLAFRNLRQGRGDHRGAGRLALFVLAFRMAAWALRGQHVADPATELDLFWFLLATSLLEAAEAWVIYLAVEPVVRRYWPRSMISWSRLLKGELGDPLVGRDLLVGCLAGSWWALAEMFDLLLPELLGRAGGFPPVSDWVLSGLRSGRDLLGNLLDGTVEAVYQAVLALLLFVLLRIVLKRPRWTVVAWWILSAPAWVMFSGDPWLSWVTIGLGVVAIAGWLLLRFGLVALAAAFYSNLILSSIPLSSETTAWYWERSLIGLAVVVAIALWGARGAARAAVPEEG